MINLYIQHFYHIFYRYLIEDVCLGYRQLHFSNAEERTISLDEMTLINLWVARRMPSGHNQRRRV